MKKILAFFIMLTISIVIGVYGNVDQIIDSLTLKPTTTAPDCSASTAGLVYVNSSTGLSVCDGSSWTVSPFEYKADPITVASGNYTISSPTKAAYLMTFSSSGGSFVFAESSVNSGQGLKLCNHGSNSFAVADTSGLSETAGTLTVGQNECYGFTYLVDRWVLDNSNN